VVLANWLPHPRWTNLMARPCRPRHFASRCKNRAQIWPVFDALRAEFPPASGCGSPSWRPNRAAAGTCGPTPPSPLVTASVCGDDGAGSRCCLIPPHSALGRLSSPRRRPVHVGRSPPSAFGKPLVLSACGVVRFPWPLPQACASTYRTPRKRAAGPRPLLQGLDFAISTRQRPRSDYDRLLHGFEHPLVQGF